MRKIKDAASRVFNLCYTKRGAVRLGRVGLKFFDDKLARRPDYRTEPYKVFDEATQAAGDKSNDYFYLHCRRNRK